MDGNAQNGKIENIPATTPAPQDLTQIREILVGPLTKDLATRMDRLENRVEQSLTDLTDQLAGRVLKLEKQFADEMLRLSSGVEEQCESNTARIRKIQEDLKGGLRELQTSAKKVAEGMSIAHESIRAELRGEIDGIRSFATDRNTLAAALTDLAAKVKG